MKIQYIRGMAPLHKMKVAAAATLVLAVFFVLFSLVVFQTRPVFSGENSAPVGVDSSFTVIEGGAHTGSVSGTDADGDTRTFQLASGPSFGTLTFNSDGSFSYLAHRQTTLGFESEDDFTFLADDGALLSEPATVTITITPVNDAPVAHESSFSVDAGQTHNGSVTGSDLDGDALSFEQLSAPMYGSLSFSALASFTYTADADYAGSDSFTFKANDGLADSSPATVTVNIEGQEVLVDEVLSGSLSEWTVDSPSGNPEFTYEEIVSPYDESTALRTRVIGNSYSPCNQPNISRTYPVGGNTDVTQLRAYLAFTSTMEYYTFPYVVIEVYDESNEVAGSQVYYGQGVIGGLYANYARNNPESYTELEPPTPTGDVTLDLSVMGESIDFASLKLTLANYACVGQNSVTFDHLRVINGKIVDVAEADTTPPVITLLGSPLMEIEVGKDYVDAGATALDNVDGDVEVVPSGIVDTTTVGTYTITYSATDTAGNSGTAIRTVRVTEPQPRPSRRSSQIIGGTRAPLTQNEHGAPKGEVLGLQTSVITKQELIDLQMQLVKILKLYLDLFVTNKI